MAKCNKDGQFSFAAGEVSVFSVCQEQWRLSYLEKIRYIKDPKEEAGVLLHKNWTKSLFQAIFLTQSVRFLCLVLLLIVLFLILPFTMK